MHSSIIHSRQYYINKAQTNRWENINAANKIQTYNNNIIDEMILNQDNNEYYLMKPTNQMIMADLEILQKPLVYKMYNRLLSSPYVRNDAFQQILIRNKANKDLNDIVGKELERINENMNFVDNILKKYKIPTDFYRKQLKKQEVTSISSRYSLLKDIMEKIDKDYDVKTNPYNFRNPDLMVENLLRSQKMMSNHYTYSEENRLSVNNGDGEKWKFKVWVWTGRGATTRHYSNDGQKVAFDDKFLIRNDSNGVLDYMDYPHDAAASFSNAGVCYCEVRYLTG